MWQCQRCPLTTTHSLQMPLRYETPERLSRANIVPNNYPDVFFGHSVVRFTNQVFDLRGYSQQTQLETNFGYKT